MSERPHICGDPSDPCDADCMNRAHEAAWDEQHRKGGPAMSERTIDPYPTACACSIVRYMPENIGGGMMRSRWFCTDCGREFVKAPTGAASITPSQTDSPPMDGGTLICNREFVHENFCSLPKGHDGPCDNPPTPPMDGGAHGVSEHDPAATQVSWEEYAGQLEQKLAAANQAGENLHARVRQLEGELSDAKSSRMDAILELTRVRERLAKREHDMARARVELVELRREGGEAESERADAVRRYEAAEVRANDLSIELRQANAKLAAEAVISDAKEERLREAVGVVEAMANGAFAVDGCPCSGCDTIRKAPAWLDRQKEGGGG